MPDWHQYAQIAIALFVIADPIAAIPIFLSLTGEQSRKEKNDTAMVAAVRVSVVLVGSIFLACRRCMFLVAGPHRFRSAAEF
jgi:multiple antibiotic resistance protein